MEREGGLPSPWQIFAAQILVVFAYVSVGLKNSYRPVTEKRAWIWSACAIAYSILSIASDALGERTESRGSEMLPLILCNERAKTGLANLLCGKEGA